MDDELVRCIKQLAHTRDVEAQYRQEIADLEAEIAATPLGQRLTRVRDELLKVAQADVADAEGSVRKRALEMYQTDGNKRPHPAVTVKEFTTLSYDSAQALDYARQHLPQAVKLDTRAFEKAAKVLELDFVTIAKDPRPTITRDLTPYVEP